MSQLLDEHLGYVADSVKLTQFKAAIEQVVKPGDRVADLGCGTAILGLLCLRAGAAHVYAIDSTPMIEVARQTLQQAGFAAQAEFRHGHCEQTGLLERVDVLICDHVGYFGFDYGIVELLADARQRMLKPDGVMIPASIALRLAAVESPASYQKAEAWRADKVPAELHWLRQYAINSKHAVVLKAEELLGEPALLGTIDFRQDHPEFFSWTVSLRMDRDGLVHGLAGWFECELADGIWMTNSPVAERAIDRPQAFLPLDEPIPVKAGDVLTATVMARPADNLIAWEVESAATGQKFRHSTWQGMLLTAEDIHSRQPDHVPVPSAAGRARMIVLGYCDGHRSTQEIEQIVLREHPELFPSAHEISRFIASVLARDSQ